MRPPISWVRVPGDGPAFVRFGVARFNDIGAAGGRVEAQRGHHHGAAIEEDGVGAVKGIANQPEFCRFGRWARRRASKSGQPT